MPLAVPVVHSATTTTLLEPRKAFEYSSSVQTADYANFAAVRSDNAGLAPTATTTTVITSAAAAAAVPVVPLLKVHHHEPAPIVETIIEPVALTLSAAQKSQYHSQDSVGRAAYGHNEALQSHHAVQDAAGNKAGSYSHVAPDGRLLTTDYVADEHGYRVATNALPIDVHHALAAVRRKRAIAIGHAVATVPLIKEATRTDILGHSSTVRLDTYGHAQHVVPAYVQAVPAVLPLTTHISYAAHPATYLSHYATVL